MPFGYFEADEQLTNINKAALSGIQLQQDVHQRSLTSLRATLFVKVVLGHAALWVSHVAHVGYPVFKLFYRSDLFIQKMCFCEVTQLRKKGTKCFVLIGCQILQMSIALLYLCLSKFRTPSFKQNRLEHWPELLRLHGGHCVLLPFSAGPAGVR